MDAAIVTSVPAHATDGPSDLVDGLRRGLLVGLAMAAVMLPPAVHSGRGDIVRAAAVPLPASPWKPQATVRFADFGTQNPSPDARHVADWVADSQDNGNAGFVVVDKKHARVYAFDSEAHLRGSSPVLLGSARGDDSVPGIGSRSIAQVRPAERTTPAGRFVAERGRNALGDDVVWLDYDAAVSMHRVRTTNPKERRLERLATPTIDDKRISYGCINVPVAFYENFIRPVFATQRAVVYVLPEVKPVQQVFGSYDVVIAQGISPSLSSKLRAEH